MNHSRLLFCLCLLMGLVLNACDDETDVSNYKVETKTAISSSTLNPNSPNPGEATNLATPTSNLSNEVSPGDKDLLTVEFDPTKPVSTISPYIYGLAGADEKDPNYGNDLRPGLMRWGGNPSTRYNWVLGNAWNAGRDFFFQNLNYGVGNSNAANEAVLGARKLNAAMLLTVPTIGWVAKNNDTSIRSLNVPDHGGPPLTVGSEAIQGYDPAANRALTSVQSFARKNAPFVMKPDPNSPAVYQDEWIASLVNQFGPASAGGVRFYAMDNEPDLWSETHTDVHPTRMSYDDILTRFVEYASAVKDVDPSAEITGPVVWGWTSYFWSELDRGSDNFKTAADRHSHGDTPFLAWFLDQLHQYEQKNGKRILDVLDIHYYPAADGVYSGSTDPKTAALRLRSTRSLWNNSYIDESWIKTQVRLIPRMQEWINQYYPGTRLGISEWNWGADDTLNGALAISQVLGIFGREGVYLAAYWRNPPADSPGFYAFKMYTNFDGQGSSFGDKIIGVKVSDDLKINAFAALDSKTGRVHLILINLQPDHVQNIEVRLPMSLQKQSANVYQLSSQTGNKLALQKPLDLPETATFKLSLPAYSATLIDLQPPTQ